MNKKYLLGICLLSFGLTLFAEDGSKLWLRQASVCCSISSPTIAIAREELAPNATVMSWRGMDGGIEAARLKHPVIMTPNNYVYLDYYPTMNTQDEPLAIGGYNPVEKVYSLEPVPASLNEEERKYIIGAQGNLWTEYILSNEHLEYMLLPRLARHYFPDAVTGKEVAACLKARL